jgi:hypothetical protein
MRALCEAMMNRMEDLQITAATDGTFVSEFDGKFFIMPENHIRCLLKTDFKDTEHGLSNRDFREVVDVTIGSIKTIMMRESVNYNKVLREISLSAMA